MLTLSTRIAIIPFNNDIKKGLKNGKKQYSKASGCVSDAEEY